MVHGPWWPSAFSLTLKPLPPCTRGFAGTAAARTNGERSSSAGVWDCPFCEGQKSWSAANKSPALQIAPKLQAVLLANEVEGLRLIAVMPSRTLMLKERMVPMPET